MSQWPHAPLHRLLESGAYIVTAGTYQKQHLFRSRERLQLLHDNVLDLSAQYKWNLQAWAVFSNHYHFVATSESEPNSLKRLAQHLHSVTARAVNKMDASPGRQVWFQYWDTHLTFERSYLARLNYVHQNPVRHGLVAVAPAYPWCSASWFQREANPDFYKKVTTCKTDQLKVPDEYDVAELDS